MEPSSLQRVISFVSFHAPYLTIGQSWSIIKCRSQMMSPGRVWYLMYDDSPLCWCCCEVWHLDICPVAAGQPVLTTAFLTSRSSHISCLNECCFLSYHHRHLNIWISQLMHTFCFHHVIHAPLTAIVHWQDARSGCANDQYDQEDDTLLPLSLLIALI